MKTTIASIAVLIATPALADPGHFAALHGHDHWVAAGTLTLAALTGAVALLKGRRTRTTSKAVEHKT